MVWFLSLVVPISLKAAHLIPIHIVEGGGPSLSLWLSALAVTSHAFYLGWWVIALPFSINVHIITLRCSRKNCQSFYAMLFFLCLSGCHTAFITSIKQLIGHITHFEIVAIKHTLTRSLSLFLLVIFPWLLSTSSPFFFLFFAFCDEYKWIASI